MPAPAALAILLGFDAALVTGFALWSLGLKGAVALLAVGLVAKVRLRARARTQPSRARARARVRVGTAGLESAAGAPQWPHPSQVVMQ